MSEDGLYKQITPEFMLDQNVDTTTKIEIIVIGTLLADYTIFEEVEHLINVDLFENMLCQKVFKFISELHRGKKPWEPVHVQDAFKDQEDEIHEMACQMSTYLQFVEYFKILQCRYFVREMQKILASPDGLELSKVESHIFNFQKLNGDRRERTLAEQFEEVSNANINSVDAELEMPTIFKQLNQCFGGFIRQQIILIIAATGQMKTVFAWNMILKQLLAGKKIFVYDYEMPDKYLIFRLIAMHYKIPLDWIQSGKHHTYPTNKITDNERDQCQKAISEMYELVLENLTIRSPALIDQIEIDIRNNRPDIVLIDTIQAACKKNPKPSGVTNADHITDICGRLNGVAQATNCAMIWTAQVNRATDGRIPSESDIKESGGIADNAAIIIGVRDRSKVSQKPEDKKVFDVNVCKNRYGEMRHFNFVTNKAIALISEWEPVMTIEEENKIEVIF